MLSIKPGSHARRIIILLLYTGEFPYYSLGMLGEIQTVKYVVRRMAQTQEVKNESGETIFYGKILNISGKGQLKTIRLNAPVLKKIESIFPDHLEFYRSLTRNHHFKAEALKIERNHRVAESIAMFLMAGVELLPSKVPTLQVISDNKYPYDDPVLYHSRYLKTLRKDELKKNQYTRMIGAVFYGSGCYCVYNTRNAIMKWCGDGENKAKKHIEDIAKVNSFITKVDHAILFGKNYDIAERTLLGLESDSKEKSVFGHIFHHIHFVPLNEFGVKLLQLYTTPYWKEDVLEQFFEAHQIRREVGVFQYDAKVGDTHFLSFMDSDIVKLRSVRNHIQTTPTALTVICFEEQTTFLKSYMGQNIRLKIIKIDEMMDTLECERRKII